MSKIEPDAKSFIPHSVAISLKRIADVLEEINEAVRRPGSLVSDHLGRNNWSTLVDIFDRIAGAIEADKAGDNAAYDAHLAALDGQVSTLQGQETADGSNIATIQAGLQKIADAVNPTPAPSGDGSATSGTNAGAAQPTPGADAGATGAQQPTT